MSQVVSERGPENGTTLPFEVVFVCTGNRARSAFAAEVLRRRVEHLPIAVSSLGTMDVGPAPALPAALTEARAHGIDLRRHRARVLRLGVLRSSGLVLGFERLHIVAAVDTGGADARRTFLLGELGAIVRLAGFRAEHDNALFESTVELASVMRDRVPLPLEAIADPLGGSRQTFRSTFTRIDELLDLIAARMFGLAGTGGF